MTELGAKAARHERLVTPWWRDAIGYSLYLRSFADGNGDGIGDLRGAVEHLGHLESLGIDLVWVSPFYPSPMVDSGYDITDHCDVDQRYGDLADFDELIAAAHARGIAVVVDLVANHTSVDHPWFRSARSCRDDPLHDHYIWADPANDGGPPNNWVSYFGGPAWTFDEGIGQYYLHLFLPEQPDLNWRNERVREAYDHIVGFWLDRGVDGFRVDVAQGLVKDARLRSNPQRSPMHPELDRIGQWAAFDHRHDILQPESRQVFRRWKQLCEPFGAVLIGELSVGDADAFASAMDGHGLDIGMWLEPMHADWGAASLQPTLQAPIERTTAGAIGWQGSSLDEPRAVTRFGGGEVGRQRALALATLMVFLPGVPFLNQGEELGLEQGVIAAADRVDPVGENAAAGRDGCRTPMPWDSGPMCGFTTGPATWLPFAGDAARSSVEMQRRTCGSPLSRYRSLLAARRAVRLDAAAAVEWIELSNPDLVGFRRGGIGVIANMASEPATVRVEGVVIFDSHDGLGHDPQAPSPRFPRPQRSGEALVLEGAQAIVYSIPSPIPPLGGV